jgi:hypothetical protein
MGESPKKEGRVIRSFTEEVKKVAYLGAAGPYLMMGDQAKSIVGGSAMVAIALVWFIICQVIAHVFIALADRMEAQND